MIIKRPKTDLSGRRRQRCHPMSENIIELSPAINLFDISNHPAEAIVALIEMLKRQEQEILDSRIRPSADHTGRWG